ncbi:MAG: glycosyltransferase family 4 protein, partial [Dysgonamonadaceae bacterium]|nr:glycosyltransferase family 4 protein [Dysgonamonadaceae bacterium]
MKRRVCIDINSIVPLIARGFLTGVGRTTLELVKEIDRIKEELPFEIMLYLQNIKGIAPVNFGISLPYKNLFLPSRDSIDRFISPFHIRTTLTKSDLWHCPHNIGQVDNVRKTIFTIHDMIAFRCTGEFEYQGVLKGLKEFPSLLQKSKAIITCSQSSKNDIIELMGVNPDNIQVTYWGVRHDLFKPLVDKEDIRKYLAEKYNINKPYFFAVSCGYGRKNTLQLLEAYVRLLKNNPDNDLVAIWNGYGEDAAQLIGKGRGRIHILNNVRDDDLVQLYNAATSLFFPSSYEGFGL